MQDFCENCKNKDEGICTDCIYCEFQEDLYEPKDKRRTKFESDADVCENCKNYDAGICTDCIYCKFQTELFEPIDEEGLMP